MKPFVLLLLACCATAAAADRDDHDRARHALKAGEILPLTRILEIAAGAQPGRVIEVDLDRDDGLWVYELEVLTPQGRLFELEIDAATGTLLEIEDEGDHD